MKTDVERKPFGAWAVKARDALDPLTVEEVAQRLSYSASSLRKVEGGSADASRRMRRELPNLYQRIARERGIGIDPPPREPQEASGATETPAALISALVRHTGALEAQTAAMSELVRWLASLAGPAVAEGVAEALRVRDAGASQAERRT